MLRNFIFKRHIIILGVCVLLLGSMGVLAAFAKSTSSAPSPASTAKAPKSFKVVPFEFDPGGTHIVEAEWGAQQGLPDASGNKNEALLLTKIGITSTNAASGANITNVKGITLTELGFDVRADGHCGAGAPRFNVITSDNVTHFAGCSAATPSGTVVDPQGNTWIIERIDPNNAAQWFPSAPGSMTIKNIQIIFDEGTDAGQGYTFLDNIDINGVLIGQP